MAKIVIVHSGKDRDLTDLFSDFLLDNLCLDERDIISVDCDRKLSPRTGFMETLKWTLADCRAAIVLYSREFVNSASCLLELGAVWALCQNTFPMQATSLDVSYYNTKLSYVPARCLLDRQDLLYLLVALDVLGCCILNHDTVEEKICGFQVEALELLRKRYGEKFKPIVSHMDWTSMEK